jgi:hypothetical protein
MIIVSTTTKKLCVAPIIEYWGPGLPHHLFVGCCGIFLEFVSPEVSSTTKNKHRVNIQMSNIELIMSFVDLISAADQVASNNKLKVSITNRTGCSRTSVATTFLWSRGTLLELV